MENHHVQWVNQVLVAIFNSFQLAHSSGFIHPGLMQANLAHGKGSKNVMWHDVTFDVQNIVLLKNNNRTWIEHRIISWLGLRAWDPTSLIIMNHKSMNGSSPRHHRSTQGIFVVALFDCWRVPFLVNVYITLENHNFWLLNQLFQWPFSIVFCMFAGG